MQVTFFQRRRRANANHSLEFIFDDVRSRLAQRIDCRLCIAPFLSNGVIRRFWNAINAWRNQGAINHVTGDINYVAMMLPRRRTILTVLDCGFLTRSAGFKQRILRLLWLKLPIRSSAIVTTISESAKAEIVEYSGCDPAKVVVIPVAISERFQSVEPAMKRTRPRLLQVGTAVNKNIKRLVEALRGIDCTLAIVGAINPELAAHIAECGVEVENLLNLSLEQVVEQYQLADVVVFASTHEGFGMPIVEAQTVGRPVVTSGIGAMKEVAGDAACLVDPFDPNSIREGIVKVLSDADYARELVRRGFENVKRFQPQVIAEQYLGLYERLDNPRNQSIV